MAPISLPGRRGARRDAAHRASVATHPEGKWAPPKAGLSRPPAALPPACGALHHGADGA